MKILFLGIIYLIISFSSSYTNTPTEQSTTYDNTDQVGKLYYDTFNTSEGLIAVYNDNLDKWGYTNANGKLVIDCIFDYADNFSDGLARVQDKTLDKWAFINTKGEFVTDYIFDNAYNFSEGIAKVEKDNKSMYINTKGEPIIEGEFDSAMSFSN